jgi:hypothetical protein
VRVLEAAGIAPSLATGERDPGIIIVDSDGSDAFIAALARHRHWERAEDLAAKAIRQRGLTGGRTPISRQ